MCAARSRLSRPVLFALAESALRSRRSLRAPKKLTVRPGSRVREAHLMQVSASTPVARPRRSSCSDASRLPGPDPKTQVPGNQIFCLAALSSGSRNANTFGPTRPSCTCPDGRRAKQAAFLGPRNNKIRVRVLALASPGRATRSLSRIHAGVDPASAGTRGGKCRSDVPLRHHNPSRLSAGSLGKHAGEASGVASATFGGTGSRAKKAGDLDVGGACATPESRTVRPRYQCRLRSPQTDRRRSQRTGPSSTAAEIF